jgi:hypothetical protein
MCLEDGVVSLASRHTLHQSKYRRRIYATLVRNPRLRYLEYDVLEIENVLSFDASVK